MKAAAVIARCVELARYSVVGLICFVAATGTLALLHEIGNVPYVPGYICAFLVSTVLGYVLHGRFTFADAGPQTASLARYLVINVFLLAANSLVFSLLVEMLRIWYIVACVLLAAANVPLTFLIHRRLSYGLGASAVDSTPP